MTDDSYKETKEIILEDGFYKLSIDGLTVYFNVYKSNYDIDFNKITKEEYFEKSE